MISAKQSTAGIRLDNALTSFDKSVNNNFRDRICKKTGRYIEAYQRTCASAAYAKGVYNRLVSLDKHDFELAPFIKQGGLGKMSQLCG